MVSARIRILSVFAAFFMLSGCRSIDSASEAKIFDGKPTSDYPAVVAIQAVGSCTGTFVSPTTVFTAAHCIHSGLDAAVIINDQIRTSKKIFSHGIEGEEVAQFALSVGQRDFAIIVFDQPVSNAKVDIGFNVAKKGSDATIVGFGATDQTGNVGIGTKREAEAKIEDIALGQHFIIVGDKNINHGDSGGPLFVDEKIVGVASFSPQAALRIGVHVNLSHPENLALMRKAVAAGADIPRIPAIDTATDPVAGKQFNGGIHCDQASLKICPVKISFLANSTATIDATAEFANPHVTLKYRQDGARILLSATGDFSQKAFAFTQYADGKMLYDANGVQYTQNGVSDTENESGADAPEEGYESAPKPQPLP